MQQKPEEDGSKKKTTIARSRSRYKCHRPATEASLARPLVTQYDSHCREEVDSGSLPPHDRERAPSGTNATNGEGMRSEKEDIYQQCFKAHHVGDSNGSCGLRPRQQGEDDGFLSSHNKQPQSTVTSVWRRNEHCQEQRHESQETCTEKRDRGQATFRPTQPLRAFKQSNGGAQDRPGAQSKGSRSIAHKLQKSIKSVEAETELHKAAADHPPPEVCQSQSAFDAPVSAINAGERKVTVEHQRSVLSVPVTNFTTPVHLIRCVGKQLGMSLDPDLHIISESFRQLGLERPLRSYEHIRDVLNSWDFDAQNALIISPRPATEDRCLSGQPAPQKQPECKPAALYHSQLVGRWEKRTVLLRSNGQIATIKKNTATNLCHLTDFEVFVPTRRQLTKRIKPPKKHCFAIKSLQKASMFLSSESFLHIFCTNDKTLATQWYDAVQGWRSWYLVNVLGEGKGIDLKSSFSPDAESHEQPGQTYTAAGERVVVTSRESQLNASDGLEGPVMHAGCAVAQGSRDFLPHDDVAAPKASRSENTWSGLYSRPGTADEPFVVTGLLGRTYTQRRKAMEDRNGSPRAIGKPQVAWSSRNGSSEKAAPPKNPTNRILGSAPVSCQRVEEKRHEKRSAPLPGLKENAAQSKLSSDTLLGGATQRGSKQLAARETLPKGNRPAASRMVDLTWRSQFVPGSLLADVEKSQGHQRKRGH